MSAAAFIGNNCLEAEMVATLKVPRSNCPATGMMNKSRSRHFDDGGYVMMAVIYTTINSECSSSEENVDLASMV
jgi:hypothetical protein